MTEYKRLDEKAWLEFGKNLLAEKDSEKQKEFLQICRSGKDGFLKYMHEHLLFGEDDIIDGEHIALKYKFSEREFLHPPKGTQQVIWDTFKDVPDEMMASCGFWGYTIIDAIKSDYVAPDYLAAELNGVTKTGIYVIDAAQKSKELIDKCVRRILRSMCNPAARGKRIVFNDFSLGKTYWRWQWARKMSGRSYIDLEFDHVLKILNENYYAAFSGKMHSGKSYISSEKVFGGLLLFLEQKKSNEEEIKGKKLAKIIDQISWLSAWKAIEMQESNLTQIEIQKISENL